MRDADEPDLFAGQEPPPPPPVPCARCGIVRKHGEEECARQIAFLAYGRRTFAALDWS